MKLNTVEKEIIHKNLDLSEKFKNKSILDMVGEQDKLVRQWIQLGHTEEQFYYESRRDGLT